MTSELRVDNLKGSTTGGSINVLGEGTSATTNLQQGLTKVWCNYDGDNNAISDSFNVSSITDAAVGIHQFDFTNAMSSVNYSCVGAAGASGFHNVTTKSTAGGTLGASSVVIRVSQNDSSTSANDDDGETSFSLNGDLA